VDPNVVLNMADNAPAPSSSTTPATDADYQLVSKVLAGTEDTWKAIFQKSGQSYQEARLVLFSGATPTACGTGQSAMGPFYCPGDHKVYLDTRFFNDMQTQLGVKIGRASCRERVWSAWGAGALKIERKQFMRE